MTIAFTETRLAFKACPRCAGDLFVEPLSGTDRDYHRGAVRIVCLQCGQEYAGANTIIWEREKRRWR